jgi:hypothetical protein
MKRWNIFARELEDILANYGLKLSHLDDRVGIHREKVRRLRASLERPKSFPVLNTEEMEWLASVLGLSEDEILRLRAAILTTAIEAMLMDRISVDDALLAAEQIFPIIFDTMYQYSGGVSGLALVKGRATNMPEENEIDAVLEPALTAIDRATIALHLSRDVISSLERSQRAHQARQDFKTALIELAEIEEHIKATDAWYVWHDEAQKGLESANERIAELGE